MRAEEILIVANQTAGGEHLKAYVSQLRSDRPARFTLLVPAAPPTGTWTWTEAEAKALAEWRMSVAVHGLRQTGAVVRGIVGDRRPIDAIGDLLMHERFDAVVVSTLPPGASRWLRQNLPRRIERKFGLAVWHVVDASEGWSDPLTGPAARRWQPARAG